MKIFSLYPLSILGSPNLTVGGNCYIIVCRIGASLMQLRNISIMYYRPFIHGSIFTVQKKRLVVCRCQVGVVNVHICLLFILWAQHAASKLHHLPLPPHHLVGGNMEFEEKRLFYFFCSLWWKYRNSGILAALSIA